MVISGMEALFDLLDSSTVKNLQKAVLGAVMNLAKIPKVAVLLNEFGLEKIVQLLPCKVSLTYSSNNPFTALFLCPN